VAADVAGATGHKKSSHALYPHEENCYNASAQRKSPEPRAMIISDRVGHLERRNAVNSNEQEQIELGSKGTSAY
jgi:hypothetical protein